MKFLYSYLLLLFFLFSHVAAKEPKELAMDLNLYPGTKASIQWKKIFNSQEKLEYYQITKLSEEEFLKLQKYLISHAADSQNPVVPLK